MPTYDYKCNACHYRFDVTQSINDPKITSCPKCKKDNTVQRLITSSIGIAFKGDGFYINDSTKRKKASNDKKSDK